MASPQGEGFGALQTRRISNSDLFYNKKCRPWGRHFVCRGNYTIAAVMMAIL